MALAIHTHHDDLLGAVAPFAIAFARSTVLVVDLDLSVSTTNSEDRAGETLGWRSPAKTALRSTPISSRSDSATRSKLRPCPTFASTICATLTPAPRAAALRRSFVLNSVSGRSTLLRPPTPHSLTVPQPNPAPKRGPNLRASLVPAKVS